MSALPYKDRLRVRVGGLLLRDDAVLLVQLHSPVRDKKVWMPPGGGLEFGESLKVCLVREFREETGLGIEVGAFRFYHELVEPPYHAIELYFDVYEQEGTLALGKDPEQEDGQQLLKALKFVPLEQLSRINVVPEKLKEELDTISS